jgi:hypothetical protein
VIDRPILGSVPEKSLRGGGGLDGDWLALPLSIQSVPHRSLRGVATVEDAKSLFLEEGVVLVTRMHIVFQDYQTPSGGFSFLSNLRWSTGKWIAIIRSYRRQGCPVCLSLALVTGRLFSSSSIFFSRTLSFCESCEIGLLEPPLVFLVLALAS